MVKMSPIIGEITAGILLGPDVANLLKVEHQDFLSLLGQFGVTLMIFESGMHVQFDKLKLVFKDSFIVAILGTGLPIACGLLYALGAFGTGGLYPDGLAMGCSMAPTSVGIALKLLTESKMLSSLTGQTIVTAAFVDDIFSILALVILLNLAKGEITPVNIIVPIVLSFGFVVGGAYLALKFWPRVMGKVLDNFTPDPSVSFQRSHQVHLLIMFLVLIGYGTAAHYVGSHLLGAFMGGMSFAAVPRSHGVWGRQMKRIAKWLIRLFFACTVAFSIPIGSMMSVDAFWKGLICGAGPCIGAKLLSGLHTGSKRWLVGFAMAGRGEFAFLVAETSKTTVMGGGSASGSGSGTDMLLSEEAYSITVWALLCATIIAPFGFKHFLAKEVAKKGESTGIYSFRLKLKGEHYGGITHDVQTALREMQLTAEDVTVETDGCVSMQTMTVQTNDPTECLDDEKFATIRHHLFEVLNDPDGQIAIQPIVKPHSKSEDTETGSHLSGLPGHVEMETQFRPAGFRADMMTAAEAVAQDRERSGRPDRHYIVVKVMSQHSPGFLEKTMAILDKEGLQVCKGKMYLVDHYPKPPPDQQAEVHAVSIKTFYCLDVSVEGTASGAPAPKRLQNLRDELKHNFQQVSHLGKALVKTTRIENAPVIFGFTPKVSQSTIVADVELVFEQRRNKSPLRRVLHVCKDFGLNTINLAVDIVEGEKWDDHNVQQATLFALVSGNPDEKELSEAIVAVFQEEDIPVRLRVQLTAEAGVREGAFGTVRGRSSPTEAHSGLSGSGSPTSLIQNRHDAASFRRIQAPTESTASRNISVSFAGKSPRHGGGLMPLSSGSLKQYGNMHPNLLTVRKKLREIDSLLEVDFATEEGGGEPACPKVSLVQAQAVKRSSMVSNRSGTAAAFHGSTASQGAPEVQVPAARQASAVSAARQQSSPAVARAGSGQIPNEMDV
eukprot:Hpha_TRINITY_DN15858_c1_g2::TRINITY_DN15858_c1_g2_i1::g.190539::m.190539